MNECFSKFTLSFYELYVNAMHQASDKLTCLHFAGDTTVNMRGRNSRQLCVWI